jgi:predicted ester cyclase
MSLSPGEQAVHAAIEAFYEAFEKKSVALLRAVVTPDWEYLPEPHGAAPGPDQMTPLFQDLATALPDMKITLLDVLVHEDRVGVRAEINGTQSGELLQVPNASNSRFTHSTRCAEVSWQKHGTLKTGFPCSGNWVNCPKVLGRTE